MRHKIVAGNWKMNNGLMETELLLTQLKKETLPSNVTVMVAPAATNLFPAVQLLMESTIGVASQNMHQSEKGAFTGEVSASMLKSIGVTTVILGHSERRAIFHEDDALLSKKVTTALVHNMTAIFCIGEELDDRKKNAHFDVVGKQLNDGLFHISESDWSNIVIAYEPVWAIGTGETASPDQAQEMHKYIRETIAANYSQEIANAVSILYGGSVKPENAVEIFAKEDVDGGLIGGAALNSESFMAIVNAF